MIERIVSAVLTAIKPAVHAAIAKELGAGLGLNTAAPYSETIPEKTVASAHTPVSNKRKPGRPKKNASAKVPAAPDSRPDADSQAGRILGLLAKGTRSGEELAEGAELTPRQVHSNLQSLRKRGLVVTKARGQYALANGVSA